MSVKAKIEIPTWDTCRLLWSVYHGYIASVTCLHPGIRLVLKLENKIILIDGAYSNIRAFLGLGVQCRITSIIVE